MSEWGSTGINEVTLGIRRSEDPVGYRKAYMMAYAAKNKKPPATFLTVDQKREKYLLCLHLGNVKRRAAAAAKKLTPEWIQKKADRTKAYQDKARSKRLVKAAKDRLENPEKYHERRVKKVKWISWHEFKPLYAEARRLTLETGEQWDVEHIYPIKSNWVCGLHTPDNLRVATRFENIRKGTQPFGPVGEELWDLGHYSTYWPGDTKTLYQKKLEQTNPA